MDKAQLQAKITAALAGIDAIFAAADTAKRPLTAEERTTVAAHEAEVAAAEAEIKALESDQASRLRLQEAKKRATESRGRQTTHDDPVIARQHENFQDDPKKGFKHRSEFFKEVIRAGRGFSEDARLKYLTVGSDEARGNSDPAGGFLVPLDFIAELLKVSPFDDPLGARTTKIPMTTPIVMIPARTDKDHSSSVAGGVTFTRRPETVAGNASQMTFEKVTLQATEIFGLSYVSEELLTDSMVSFTAILEAGFQDQRAYHMTKERLFGTGVGEYLGMANSANPCLVSVAKETGQAATTLVYENVVKMRSRCWGYGDAIWLANYDTMPSFVLMNQAVGTGGAVVFQPSAREGVPDMLLGRPLIFTEFCKTLGSAGDVILANATQYLEGIYQPLQSAESMHVRFVNHERVFKFWERNAGWPWWKTALTPVNSTATLSPFIITAVRA